MDGHDDVKLEEGSRVGVIGGGPAGSFFSYFLLEMAERIGLGLQVDIFEPRDFSVPGPQGCNMCGGIISESLVQHLATEGIRLPTNIVQRGIASYTLHTDVGSVLIQTPRMEKRIGAVYRAPGPRGLKELKWGGFDGHLLGLAQSKGARVTRGRVERIARQDGRWQLTVRGQPAQAYDLLVVTAGVNSAAHRLFENLNLAYRPPRTVKTYICEYHLGQAQIAQYLGDSMHVFLLNLPGLEFAAIIPKGDYVTLCLLGEGIDERLVRSLTESPEVQRMMPPDWRPDQSVCQCQPRIAVEGAQQPYGDQIVFIGDCSVTRLYKDGIGSAYRTAKAAAATVIFHGTSAADFAQHYLPTCRSIAGDNLLGKLVFFVTRQIQHRIFAQRAVVRMTSREQRQSNRPRRMSLVLWDTFTGSSPYRDILLRTLHPAFWLEFLGHLAVALADRAGRVLVHPEHATPEHGQRIGAPGEGASG
ncbi:MAG: hypothetical protein IT317_22235 [Anaerolineales bacterium]|nr:hypothetical protein [Anaerolineales bacterium]